MASYFFLFLAATDNFFRCSSVMILPFRDADLFARLSIVCFFPLCDSDIFASASGEWVLIVLFAQAIFNEADRLSFVSLDCFFPLCEEDSFFNVSIDAFLPRRVVFPTPLLASVYVLYLIQTFSF